MNPGAPAPKKPRRLSVHNSARGLAAQVVSRVLDDDAFTQQALASALASSGLDARDKALVTELVYGTLRFAAPLEASILRGTDKPQRGLDKRIRPHMLVAAYQLQHLSERIPAHAAVSAAVDGVRRERPGLDGFANAVLRRLGSPLHAHLKDDATQAALAQAFGIPPVLADALDVVLPRVAAFAGFCARPTTFAMALTSVPDDVVRHAFVPGAFALDGGAVTDSARFKEGAHIVMDPGSAVPALLLDAKPGQTVLDLCAAPGGKTVLLAKAVGESGRVVAIERDARRSKKIEQNLERTGMTARVDILVGDGLELELPMVDAVLLDAPCTGFGTTRRKPEIKLRRTADDVATNQALQSALLKVAMRALKPGGVLVYSVCSPLAAEGAVHIAEVCAAGFAIADARATLPFLPADAVDDRGAVHLYPHLHDADAFFAARFIKQESI